jgi:predicted CXXCH cytochrome family protein
VIDQRADGDTVNWRTECSFCHVTGLDTTAWEFQEFGIGCEDCHGPGKEHANNPQEVAVFKQTDDQVCGACHSRGTSPEGHPFPASYKPGDTLTEHFTFTADETTRWPDGSAKIHNQQYTDWIQSNKMEGPDGLRCTTCHEVHAKGQGPSQTVLPTNEMCSGCHAEKATLARHIPYHQQAITKRDFTCNNCHMPLMATSAVEYDIHNHTFQQPNPQGSLDHGGTWSSCPTPVTSATADRAESAGVGCADDRLGHWRITPSCALEYIFPPGPTPTCAARCPRRCRRPANAILRYTPMWITPGYAPCLRLLYWAW